MGATFLEDEPFSVRFALKCKREGTSDNVTYKGTIRQKASIKAVDDTHQSKNFVRMINSCAKEGKPCDGIEVWCPKNLLRKCCEVFDILVSDERWEEGRVNVYEFQKYTAPVLEAFVQYLYTSNTEAPSKHPAIALELLEMAHLYQYKDLECSMIAVLQGQPWIWYDIITAWNMLVFSTKRMNCSVRLMGHLQNIRLQNKAKEVIKMFLSTGFIAKHDNRYGLRNRAESPEMTTFKVAVERNQEFFTSQFNIDPNTFL